MIEWVSLPRPESCRMSVMSRSLAGAPLIRYSDSPERYILRVMATSPNSMGSVWSELSKTSVTSASPTACLPEEPEKITSSMAWPRSILALCSPRTHRIESEMFDLPLPFGPTTTLRPGSKTMAVRSAKDLNPLSVSDFRYTCQTPSREGATPPLPPPRRQGRQSPCIPCAAARRAPPRTPTPSSRSPSRARRVRHPQRRRS